MSIEVDPEQPPEVVHAIEAIAAPPAATDPWWKAGLDEALYGDVTARPRSTVGADRA